MQSLTSNSNKLPSSQVFLCGAGAGIITVYTTMPFDVIKTRMQSIEAPTLYRSSLDCLQKVVLLEGVPSLWGGSVARLSRLMVSP